MLVFMFKKISALSLFLFFLVTHHVAFGMEPLGINDFNKPIEEQKIQSVLNTKGLTSTIKIIQSSAEIYKIKLPTSETSATENQILVTLPAVPEKIISAFGRSTLEKLLGLFLPQEEHTYLITHDVILYRTDAGLWTVIHEYFHFLFNQSRKRTNHQNNPDFKNILRDASESYNETNALLRKNNYKFTSQNHEDEFKTAAMTLVRNTLDNILNFSAEEIVIEELLQKTYLQQKNRNELILESEDYSYSFKYVQKNVKLALRDTQYILQIIEQLKQHLSADHYNSVRSELESYEKKYLNIINLLNKRNTDIDLQKTKPTVQTVQQA